MAAVGLIVTEGRARPARTTGATGAIAAVAVFLAANPLWVGGTYKPAWLEVGLWLLIEAALLLWLIKERAPAKARALGKPAQTGQTSLYSASTTSPSPDSPSD